MSTHYDLVSFQLAFCLGVNHLIKIMESPNVQHQGELSLLEMIQTMKSSSADVTLPSSVYSIELNDEKLRRLQCEKHIQQLQNQVWSLQQDYAVSEETIKRKDALLMQAHQEWKTSEVNWKQKLANAEISKKNLESEIVQLKTQLQSAAEEKQSALLEMKNIHQRNDEVKRESLQLRDLNEQYLNQIGTLNLRCDECCKELQRNEEKLDDIKREYNRMMGQIEDLKRDKNNSDVELELLQERYESSRHQWELHCQTRIQETMQLADQDSERRLQNWQKEVETKVRHAVSSLEQQLGLLKEKNVEETRLMVTRHGAEVKDLRERCSLLQNKVQKRHREYEQLTQNMKQLLEARESRHREDRGRGYSDQDSVVSDISIAVSSSTITKQDELQQYVEQVMRRHRSRPS